MKLKLSSRNSLLLLNLHGADLRKTFELLKATTQADRDQIRRFFAGPGVTLCKDIHAVWRYLIKHPTADHVYTKEQARDIVRLLDEYDLQLRKAASALPLSD